MTRFESFTFRVSDIVIRYHKTCYSSSCPSWWCQAYFRSYLWRDSWCPKDLPRKRLSDLLFVLFPLLIFFLFFLGHPGLGNIYRAREAKDCDSAWCCVCTKTIRPNTVWFRCLDVFSSYLVYFTLHVTIYCNLLHSRIPIKIYTFEWWWLGFSFLSYPPMLIDLRVPSILLAQGLILRRSSGVGVTRFINFRGFAVCISELIC